MNQLTGLFLLLSLSFVYGCSANSYGKHSEWRQLFNGDDLSQWMLVHGNVPFTVEDGAIVGRTVAGIPTRYLTTKDQFGDFILELDMYNKNGANSGIQFRSVTTAPFYDGLTGYQLEVDPSNRSWTGGIYFEGVGEWRHTPIFNPECQNAWHQDTWNTLRIEAKGYEQKTFVNGVLCSYLFDHYLTKGHIGLQVHSVGDDPSMDGLATRWRNIRIIENPTNSDYTPSDLNADSSSHLIDQLSAVEAYKGWQLTKQVSPEKNRWEKQTIVNPIDGETFHIDALTVSEGQSVTLLPTGNSSEAFHFITHFKMLPNTQGEIRYPVVFRGEDGKDYTCNASFRLNDDRNSVPVETQTMGDLTHVMSAGNLSEPGRPKRVLFSESWRWLEIKSTPESTQHWLNGVKVLEYSQCHTMPLSAFSDNADSDITLSIKRGSVTLRTVKHLLSL
ncbi:3-keto-disaccharide hydrolase [Agaribacter flavus]|uniref:DUF1080 domain-containing protein n=1 Tax=Agaribacter flavus TaxID=1902781 RepID=A0ABV7FTZ1_9ALTE